MGSRVAKSDYRPVQHPLKASVSADGNVPREQARSVIPEHPAKRCSKERSHAAFLRHSCSEPTPPSGRWRRFPVRGNGSNGIQPGSASEAATAARNRWRSQGGTGNSPPRKQSLAPAGSADLPRSKRLKIFSFTNRKTIRKPLLWIVSFWLKQSR